jgi:hypothetical protein
VANAALLSRRPKSGWSSVTVKKKRKAETAPLNVRRLHAAGAIGYFAYVTHDAYMSEAQAKAEGDRPDHGKGAPRSISAVRPIIGPPRVSW